MDALLPTATSAIAGACAGVLGLTNLYGFAFYLAAYLFVGGVIFLGKPRIRKLVEPNVSYLNRRTCLANCRTRSDLYFRSTLEVFTGGAMDNALSYVLCEFDEDTSTYTEPDISKTDSSFHLHRVDS